MSRRAALALALLLGTAAPLRAQANDTAAAGCVRGAAAPLLRADGGHARFRLLPAGARWLSEETAPLAAGDSVRMFQGGCESYAVGVEFDLRARRGDPSGPRDWLRRAAALLRALDARLAEPGRLREAAEALEARAAAAGPPPAYGEEIAVGEPNLIATAVQVERPRIRHGRVHLVVTCATGPL
jgi:hypothetical protein